MADLMTDDSFPGLRPLADLLAPIRVMPVVPTALRDSPEDRQRRERERKEGETALTARLLDAERDWLATAEALVGNRTALAVLDLHLPEADGIYVVCSECCDYDGYEGGCRVEWPCPTYRAIRETCP